MNNTIVNRTQKKYIVSRVFFFFIFLSPAVSQSVDRFVDPVIGVDNLTCDSANPCQTILNTVGLSLNNDVINLAPGTYSESPITITTDLTISGAGKANTFIEPASTPNRLFTIASSNVIIEKVTIQNGDVYDTLTFTYENGGAILLNSGSLLIRNSALLNNEALAGGAIEQASSGYLIIVGTRIQDNWASALGGAIHCDSCGGVFLILDSLKDNSASEGGAIEIEYSELISVLSSISRNFALKGGAVSGAGGEIHLFNNQIADNTATANDGGAIFANGLLLNIQKTTFSGNDASYLSNGGAITVFGNAGLTVANSTFSSNTAHFAGAIAMIDNYGVGPVATINNSTFFGNEGLFDANHISSGLASITNYNNIIIHAGVNAFADECVMFNVPGGVSNLVDDTTCGFPINQVTNLDTTLTYNGGVTKTHDLLTGSNAIDTGSNADCVNPYNGLSLQYDQRGIGNVRPVNSVCDIGAIEIQ